MDEKKRPRAPQRNSPHRRRRGRAGSGPARDPARRRRELGQNLLADRGRARQIAGIALERAPGLDVVELGAGTGALTAALLARLKGRRLDVVELDPRFAAELRDSLPRHVRVHEADMLRWPLPARPYAAVANAPFRSGTALLRRLLGHPRLQRATVVLQWDVVRRRAEGGGGTLLGAAASPWFRLRCGPRLPASSFRPVPRVDAGLLIVERREQPLLEPRRKAAFERMLRIAFEGGGPLRRTLAPAGIPRGAVRRWLGSRGLPTQARARDLGPEDWVDLFELRTSRRA